MATRMNGPQRMQGGAPPDFNFKMTNFESIEFEFLNFQKFGFLKNCNNLLKNWR
jgi:hypothetical protein